MGQQRAYTSVNFRGHADDIITVMVTGAEMDRINKWMAAQGKDKVQHRYPKSRSIWVLIKIRRIDHMFYLIANR